MLDAKVRTGKELHEFKLAELIVEYKKVNSECGAMIQNALELDVLDIRKEHIESKTKDYIEYASKIANEFITRHT